MSKVDRYFRVSLVLACKRFALQVMPNSLNRTGVMQSMKYLFPRSCLLVVLILLGCSDDSTRPGGAGVTAFDILSSPVGTINIDGREVTLQGSYHAAPVGGPLEVVASLSEQNATVTGMWFVSGLRLEHDENPQACFIPNRLCVSHVTKLEYKVGLEFVVALDIEASGGDILRVRSEFISVQRPPMR